METPEPTRRIHFATFDTAIISAKERFEVWREFCRNAPLTQECLAKSADFGARIDGFFASATSVMKLDVSACRIVRDPEKASDSHPDLLVLYFVLSGSILIEQDGRSSTITSGDGVVCVGDRPFRLTAQADHGLLAFKLPRSLMSNPADLRDVTARSFRAASEVAPMAIDLAHGIWKQKTQHPAVLDRLSRTLLDLTETTFQLFAPEEGNDKPSARAATLRRIKRFVQEHVHDDELNPALVAQALRLSKRYMNKLFNHEGTALGRYIWDVRLQKAADRLGDPFRPPESITSVAFSLGFKDLSHFSSAFRERYKMSPTEYRNARRFDL